MFSLFQARQSLVDIVMHGFVVHLMLVDSLQVAHVLGQFQVQFAQIVLGFLQAVRLRFPQPFFVLLIFL